MSSKKLTADEIRLRGLLLAKNKELLQLHRELVMGGLIREEDFWETRRDLLDSQEVLLQQKRPQTINLAGPEIRGSTDIAGDLKFVLTPTLIQSIFEQNPTVKRAFDELVKTGAQMDEKAFWMAYFKSKFFKEGLAAGSSNNPTSPDNPLDKYYDEAQLLAEEENALPDQLSVSIDPAVDLGASVEDHFRAADPLQTVRLVEGKAEKSRAAIKKFNKLSLGVIESSGMHRIVEEDGLLDSMLLNRAPDLPLAIESIEMKQQQPLIPSSKVPAKRDSDDTDHRVKERQDFMRELNKQFPLEESQFKAPIYSFDDYSQLMAGYPLSKPTRLQESSSEQVSIQQQPTLSSVTPEGLQLFTVKVIEILKQFWSAYPPGKDASKKDKVTRMANVLRGIQETLDSWMLATDSLEEKQYYQNTFESLMKATNHAINLSS